MPAWAGMGPGMAPSLMRRLDQGEAGLEGRKVRLQEAEAGLGVQGKGLGQGHLGGKPELGEEEDPLPPCRGSGSGSGPPGP